MTSGDLDRANRSSTRRRVQQSGRRIRRPPRQAPRTAPGNSRAPRGGRAAGGGRTTRRPKPRSSREATFGQGSAPGGAREEAERREARHAGVGSPSRSSTRICRLEPASVAEPRRNPSHPSWGSPVSSGRPQQYLVVAAAALWLVPLALNRSTQSPPNAAPAPATEVAAQKQPNATAPVSAATPAAPASTARGGSRDSDCSAGTCCSGTRATAAPPGPAADPPAATTGTVSPRRPGYPNETTVANFRNHVQTLLAKKDAEQASSVLTEALAYAPADKGLRAMSPKVLDQARARPRRSGRRRCAGGRPGGRSSSRRERTMRECADARPRTKTEASARAYFDAADLFASAAAGAAAAGGAAGPKKKRRFRKRPNPSLLPQLRRRNAIRRPLVPKPLWAAVDPVIDAYASAMSRGDRGALLAVYPNPRRRCWPLSASGQAATDMRIDNRFMVSDSRGRPEVALSVVHESLTASGAREEKHATHGADAGPSRRAPGRSSPAADAAPRIPIRRPACRGLRSGRAGQRRPLPFLLVAVSRDPDQGSARHPARRSRGGRVHAARLGTAGPARCAGRSLGGGARQASRRPRRADRQHPRRRGVGRRGDCPAPIAARRLLHAESRGAQTPRSGCARALDDWQLRGVCLFPAMHHYR